MVSELMTSPFEPQLGLLPRYPGLAYPVDRGASLASSVTHSTDGGSGLGGVQLGCGELFEEVEGVTLKGHGEGKVTYFSLYFYSSPPPLSQTMLMLMPA